MGISPIEMQGGINRTQDYSILKHQEDTKVTVQQMDLHIIDEKKNEQKSNQVNQSDGTGKSQTHHDAKDEGKNKYMGDGGQNRRNGAGNQNGAHKDGVVVKKEGGNFDFRI